VSHAPRTPSAARDTPARSEAVSGRSGAVRNPRQPERRSNRPIHDVDSSAAGAGGFSARSAGTADRPTTCDTEVPTGTGGPDELRSHTRTTPSWLPVAAYRPSGPNANRGGTCEPSLISRRTGP
jgi:hypothetical protein